MLGVQFNPNHTLQDTWLKESARLLGAHDSYGPTPQGIDFAHCVGCAQCITGCPYGAKNSLDLNYLAQAEALGVEIRPQSRAEILMPLTAVGGPGTGGPDGHDPMADGTHGWRVVVRDPLAPSKRAGINSLTAREVVLAGGVLGTNELLLANRDRWQTLPNVSPALGKQVRTNSEAFAAVLHPEGTDISEGATISSHYYPDAVTHVTNNRFPKSYSFMKWYLCPAVPSRNRDHGGAPPSPPRCAGPGTPAPTSGRATGTGGRRS